MCSAGFKRRARPISWRSRSSAVLAGVGLAFVASGGAQAAPRAPFPWHRQVVATVFWIGEPRGNGSSENNALSAYDDAWRAHYGGTDDPFHRRGYRPAGFRPQENPFYLDLPYSDFRDDGAPRPERRAVVPWARGHPDPGPGVSLMKNRWVQLRQGLHTCYGQIEDAGPYVYDDSRYVFGTAGRRPRNRHANHAGLDVAPALRDCLRFSERNGDHDRVDWRWVARSRVPPGQWLRVVTTRQRFCTGGCA